MYIIFIGQYGCHKLSCSALFVRRTFWLSQNREALQLNLDLLTSLVGYLEEDFAHLHSAFPTQPGKKINKI